MLFGNLTWDNIIDKEIILYGSGQFGRQVKRYLNLIDIYPKYYCNSFVENEGEYLDKIKVINPSQILKITKKPIILIVAPSYAALIKKNLLANGFCDADIYMPSNVDPYVELFFGDANYFDIYGKSKNQKKITKIAEEYCELAKSIDVYIHEKKSKNLLWAKTLQSICWNDIAIFKLFMETFSEAIRIFGTKPFNEYGPENYFYFNNDVVNLPDDAIYIDIGAFNGDSIKEFIAFNKIKGLKYRKIIAFEPDPCNYAKLLIEIPNSSHIINHNFAVSNTSGNARFVSSISAASPSGGGIATNGDICVSQISLDEFIKESKVTLIKMDPPGEIISSQILAGAFNIINTHRPTIIIGIHSLKELSILTSQIAINFSFYELILRHNSWGPGEVDLYLIPKIEFNV